MISPVGMGQEMVAKWKTAGLVFLLALTMSTAVLAAGGIGVSQLARPVSQVPPAPDVSPFRVVAGVPVIEDAFAAVPAPQVAPPEFRGQAAAAATEADVAAFQARRGRRAPAAVPAPVPPAVRPAPAAAPGRQAAPRPAPSGGDNQPAEPRPAPPVKEGPDQGETVQPDAAPVDDDERLRAAGADDERTRRNRGNGQPKPQDHKHRAPESRQAQSNGNSQGSQGQPEGQSQPQSAGGGQPGGGSQKH